MTALQSHLAVSNQTLVGLCQGGLLKDQLQMVKVTADGRSRYSIKPIEEQLSFDKARAIIPALL